MPTAGKKERGLLEPFLLPEPIGEWYDPARHLPVLLDIRAKTAETVPFHPNRMQAHYYQHQTYRDIAVKARQLGFSRGGIADRFIRTCYIPDVTLAIVSKDEDLGTTMLLQCKDWLKRLQYLGIAPTVGLNNEKRITFPRMNSQIYLETAKGTKPGRGDTINMAWCTEVAHWDDAEGLMAALEAAIPKPPFGVITVESSPNGAAGYFHDEYFAAKEERPLWDGASVYSAFFYPWWFADEYRITPPPGFEKHLSDEEKRLQKKHRLGMDQLYWRRVTMNQYARSGLFLQEYPEDDVSCFLTSGRPVFAREIPQQMSVYTRLPLEIDDDMGGALKVWVEPMDGKQYVIGVDMAEGIGLRTKEADDSAAAVIDWQTLEHVATLRANTIDPVEFSRLVYKLGEKYNWAFVAVERRAGAGYAANNRLAEELRYPNLYHEYDERTNAWKGAGWMTDMKSKPVMIENFRELLQKGQFTTHDSELVRQVQTYVHDTLAHDRNPDSRIKTRAEHGSKDDLLMAAMIACEVRKYAPPPRGQRARATRYAVV